MSKQRTLPIEIGFESLAQLVPGSHRISTDPEVIAHLAINSYKAIQKHEELAQLLHITRDLKPQTVVEIGTQHGGTLFSLGQFAADNALLVSIDMPRGEGGGGYRLRDEMSMNRRKVKTQEQRFIRADSHDRKTDRYSTEGRLNHFLGNRAIDLLFIDGDHRYGGAMQDLKQYGKYVRPGGIIAFHDIVPNPLDPNIEVDKVWDVLKQSGIYEGNMEELICPQPSDGLHADCAGIGIIHM